MRVTRFTAALHHVALRRVFWLAFAGFFLVSAAWAVALPVNGTYDEKHHLVRAYAVVSGQWFPAGPATEETGYGTEGFDVPASLLPGGVDCTWFDGRRPASCQVPTADRTTVRVASNVARYSPVYYLPVGLPLLVWPDHTGILLGRLISALLCSLLLAAAATVAVRLGSRLLLAGVVLVATPMTVNLAGSINPNGVEIAAGVLIFTTLLALLRGADGPGPDRAAPDGPGPDRARRLLLLTGVAAALMLTVRQLGPLLLAVDVAACLAVAGPGRIRALWRRRDARWILGGSAAAGALFYGYWTLASGVTEIKPTPGHTLAGAPGELLRRALVERVPFYLHQVVGQFGYGETTISPYAVYAWYALWGVLVLPALLWAGWRVRLVLVGLLAFSGALLLGLEVRLAPLVGWTQHGRYVLPCAVGVVLVAAARWPGAPLAALSWPPLAASGWRAAAMLAGRRWFAVGLVGMTLPLHAYALARVMTRYQVGIDAGLNPLHGSWLPPGGPLLPLALLTVGLAALLGLVLAGRGDRTVQRPPDSDGHLSTTEPAAH